MTVQRPESYILVDGAGWMGQHARLTHYPTGLTCLRQPWMNAEMWAARKIAFYETLTDDLSIFTEQSDSPLEQTSQQMLVELRQKLLPYTEPPADSDEWHLKQAAAVQANLGKWRLEFAEELLSAQQRVERYREESRLTAQRHARAAAVLARQEAELAHFDNEGPEFGWPHNRRRK